MSMSRTNPSRAQGSCACKIHFYLIYNTHEAVFEKIIEMGAGNQAGSKKSKVKCEHKRPLGIGYSASGEVDETVCEPGILCLGLGFWTGGDHRTTWSRASYYFWRLSSVATPIRNHVFKN